VRAFAVQNALMWLRDYRFDGLRLDATHALAHPGAGLLLTELSAAVGDLARRTGRHIHLTLENDDNRASLLDPLTDPAETRYRAQWNDDYHHAWHALLTGERHGYYSDFADPPAQIARALSQGFVYQGEASQHRAGAARGEPSRTLSPLAFVNFLQNHDQIGNRALGERLESLAGPAAVEAALDILLLAPMPPMLFMGDEWGATSPFPFFCDFQGDLADAIRAGRRREFGEAYARHGDDVPDPLDADTFARAKLDWSAAATPQGRARLQRVSRLLRLRREEIAPHLDAASFGEANLSHRERLLDASWGLGSAGRLRLQANLSADALVGVPMFGGRIVWGEAGGAAMSAWSVRWSIGP
jgi:malto-oligosyltrehalose trehalohydrolase